LIAFAIGTGMREGEIYNLHLRDLKPDKVIVRFGSKGKATKGGRIRRVPLFGISADAIAQWLPLLAQQPNPEGLVWPTKRGGRRERGKAPRGWRGYLLAAGIIAEHRHDGRPVRFHDLRHTCGSSLVAGWWGRRWTLEEVKELLGHRSIITTQRYAHLADSALDAAARETVAPTIGPRDTVSPRPDSRSQGFPKPKVASPILAGGAQGSRALTPIKLSGAGLIVDLSALSARAVEALRAMAGGGPDAWRLAGDVLTDLARLGYEVAAQADARAQETRCRRGPR
jgi:hypothetical protein